MSAMRIDGLWQIWHGAIHGRQQWPQTAMVASSAAIRCSTSASVHGGASHPCCRRDAADVAIAAAGLLAGYGRGPAFEAADVREAMLGPVRGGPDVAGRAGVRGHNPALHPIQSLDRPERGTLTTSIDLPRRLPISLARSISKSTKLPVRS